MEIIHIKNMVCDRCIRSVEKIFSSHNVTTTKVLLGEVHTQNKVHEILIAQIEKALKGEGFELIGVLLLIAG